MDPARKRTLRLGVALTAALLLAGALIYTSFTASTEAKTPSELAASALPGRSYELTGRVAAGSVHQEGRTLLFSVQDRKGSASVPVSYTGEVPDPFRVGREVIVQVRREGDRFVGAPDSLTTKCPSKFKAAPPKAY